MRVIIVGAGFAGIAATKELGKHLKAKSDIEIILFDKNSYTTMIPNLIDMVGEEVTPSMVTGDIKKQVPPNIEFKNEEIKKINIYNKKIFTVNKEYSYDYLVIASGSITNFYGFNQYFENVHTLTSFNDAKEIHDEFTEYVNNTDNPTVVIVGAGYTGIELAAQLNPLAEYKGKSVKIILVEKNEDIMPFLTKSQRDYVKHYLEKNNFKLLTGTSVTEFDGKNIKLSNGEKLDNVFLCWTTGTKFSIPEIEGNFESLNDGRIKVNEYLQIPNHQEVYTAGDSAAIKLNDDYLRKAVNFAIYSGKQAGHNIAEKIKNEKMEKFHPVDLGWILPLGDTSIGLILNRIPVRGKIGMRFHYFMSGYRNYSWENRIKDFKLALKI